MTDVRKVWFITGTSSGLGRYLASTALLRGDRVIATARDLSGSQGLRTAGAHVMQLDVREEFHIIQRKAAEALNVYGRIDVVAAGVVNNARYGMFGALEEVGADGYMDQYKTNVFGVINVTNAFLPHMRSRRSGTVIIVGGRSDSRVPTALAGPSGSSKAAVNAIAESLTDELRGLGIRVLLVQPGGFHSRLVNDSLEPKPRDPQAAVNVIADVVRGEGCAVGKKWPDVLILGEEAENGVRFRCLQVLERLDDQEWRDVARDVGV